MDSFMIIWVFLIGVIVGVILALSLLYTTAILPLHRKIERLTSEYQSLLKINDQNNNND